MVQARARYFSVAAALFSDSLCPVSRVANGTEVHSARIILFGAEAKLPARIHDTINSHYIFPLLYFPMYSRCANRTQAIISLIIELSVPKITATSYTWKRLQGHEFGVIHNSITVRNLGRNLVRKVFWQDSLNL